MSKCKSQTRRASTEVVTKIFDPYFTTKATASGLGYRSVILGEETWGLPAARKHFTAWIHIRILLQPPMPNHHVSADAGQ